MSMPSTPIAPKPKASKLPWIIGGCLAALLIAIAVVGLVVSIRPAHIAATAPAPTSAAEHLITNPEPALPTDTPEPTVSLEADNVKLTAKITSKECFGSAGCNVSFKVRMAYSGPTLSTDDTWEVTYEVTGIEDGPLVGSFNVTGDEYEVNEESVSTTSSKKKLTIKVTSVDKVGI
jgi:hypothetical protein